MTFALLGTGELAHEHSPLHGTTALDPKLGPPVSYPEYCTSAEASSAFKMIYMSKKFYADHEFRPSNSIIFGECPVRQAISWSLHVKGQEPL